jgi:hypothetical protein
MVDVYYFGEHPSTPAGLAALLGPSHASLVLQRFDGLFGDTYSGAWYREGSTIFARPDPAAQPWEPHPALDWLHRDGSEAGISWSVVASFAHFDIVNVYPQATQPTFDDSPIGVTYMPSALSWRAYALSKIPFFWRYAAGEPEVAVDNVFYSKLTTSLFSRTRGAWNYRTVSEEAKRDLAQHYPHFSALFPQMVERFLVRHTETAWFNSTLRIARDVKGYSAPAGAEVNATMNNLAKPVSLPVPAPKKCFIAGLGGLLLFIYRREVLFFLRIIYKLSKLVFQSPLQVLQKIWTFLPQIHRLVPANILAVFCPRFQMLSPFLEEILKMHPVGTAVVAITDAVLHDDAYLGFFHFATQYLPFWLRLPIHYAFNYYVQSMSYLGCSLVRGGRPELGAPDSLGPANVLKVLWPRYQLLSPLVEEIFKFHHLAQL